MSFIRDEDPPSVVSAVVVIAIVLVALFIWWVERT